MSVPQRLDILHKYLLSFFYHKSMCVCVPINTSTLGGGSRREMVVGVVERGGFFKLRPCGGMRMIMGQAESAASAASHTSSYQSLQSGAGSVHLLVRGVGRRGGMQCKCTECGHKQTPSDIHARAP